MKQWCSCSCSLWGSGWFATCLCCWWCSGLSSLCWCLCFASMMAALVVLYASFFLSPYTIKIHSSCFFVIWMLMTAYNSCSAFFDFASGVKLTTRTNKLMNSLVDNSQYFNFKIKHLVNSMHPLWLHLSAEHHWWKYRVHLRLLKSHALSIAAEQGHFKDVNTTVSNFLLIS